MRINEFLINKNISKSTVALSNDVYEYKNWFYKKYATNSFKEVFKNQDMKILNLLEKTKFELKYKAFDDGVATKKIFWNQPSFEEISFEELSLLVKEVIVFNHLHETKEHQINHPGFFEAISFFDELDYVSQVFQDEKEIIEDVKENAFKNTVLCHNDLIPGNVFFKTEKNRFRKAKIKLIDFEYTGIINFHFDIAIMMNSWVIDKSKYFLISNEFSKTYEIDHEYLKKIRIFLLIFWSKLCDYKYHETNKDIYQELKIKISGFREKVEEQYVFSKIM